MIRTDLRSESSSNEPAQAARRSTLPPPVWAAPASPAISGVSPMVRPLARSSGTRAEEAWLRARAARARAGGDKESLRQACAALARWLGSRDRCLDEAVEMALSALALGTDLDLRRELSTWLESLGDAAQAAAVLRPIAAAPEVDSPDVGHALVRAGTLRARSGDAAGAVATLEAALAIDPEDALSAETLAGLLARPGGVGSEAQAADAYLEASRRRATQGRHDSAIENLWRGFALDPSASALAEELAAALAKRGRRAGVEEVRRRHARALAVAEGRPEEGLHEVDLRLAQDRSPADADTLKLMDRMVATIGPIWAWCVALSEGYDAAGNAAAAIGWAQRCVNLRPGDIAAVETLLQRLVRWSDAARLADTLAWLLAQPLPADAIVDAFGRGLLELCRLDVDRAVIVARRALDVFGPIATPVRAAMLQVAMAACDDAFIAAIFERWLSCGAAGVDRQKILVGLAELYERLGDDEAQARVVAIAMREELRAPAVEAHLERLLARPASPDARIHRLEAQAHRLTRSEGGEAAARAWRELGGALWDLADDRAGAIAAWQRAARSVTEGGHAALAVDMVTFADASSAHDYLRQLIDSERDDPTAAAIAAEVSRAVLSLGVPRMALDLAANGLSRCPSSVAALSAAEASAAEARELTTLSGLYDLVGDRALGRFGRRAAHYRGARFFERVGESSLALRHAIACFKALATEGSALQLLARTAERAANREDAVRAVEQVAAAATQSEQRSGWLLCAARLAGYGTEGTARTVDLLLAALIAHPRTATVTAIGEAARDLLRSDPARRQSLRDRIDRTTADVAVDLQGPDGARVALALSRLAIQTFGDGERALSMFERAFACDADVESFGDFAPGSGALMAHAADAARRVEALVSRAASAAAPVGVATWRMLFEVAAATGEARLAARAAVGAAISEPGDDDLIVAADSAVRAFPDLLGTAAERVLTRARRSEALLARARRRPATEGGLDASTLYKRALDLVEPAARGGIEHEMRNLRAAATTDDPAAPPEGDNETPEARADRWTEVADRREARGEMEGAVAALREACKLDPTLGRWSAVERVAEAMKDDETRIAALREIAERVRPEGRAAVFKRLAHTHAGRNDRIASERAWREVLTHDPTDEEADKAVEAAAVAEGRYADLAEHLAARAARLAADPSQSEALRAVRLRRAAILEQRLGRVQDACDELTLLLTAAPNNQGALRFLADLEERQAHYGAAATLWARAAGVERDLAERDTLELRAARAAAAGGDYAAVRAHAAAVLQRRPGHVAALELMCEAARGLGDDRDLGVALEDLAVECPPSTRGRLLVDAALAAARGGDLDRALDRACRAADATPDQATAQLLARGLEYRQRGAGTSEDARLTVAQLARIEGSMGGDDAALRAFLMAEAMDVIEGAGAGAPLLEEAREMVGPHPLIALGLAERLAARGQLDAAIDAYRVALSGPLLGLRSSGAVALSATDLAIRARRPRDAAHFLDVADRFDDSAGPASVRRERLQQGSGPNAEVAPAEVEVPRSAELQSAIEDATSASDLARARVALAKAKLERGEGRTAEVLLREALSDGLVEAGDVLAQWLMTASDRHRDVVQVRYQQVLIEPGHVSRLEALREAALADSDTCYANAVGHVLVAFGHRAETLPAPALASQPEQPGLFNLLIRPSMDAAGEALALLWEGGWQLFARDTASYAITGVERVVPGPTSPIARLYATAIRVLHPPRIPLYVARSTVGAPSAKVALLQAPSVILSGDLRSESTFLRYELGVGMSYAIAQNVLRLGLGADQGRLVTAALMGAFGPPEQGGHLDVATARMAESFWQVLPPRSQRRIQSLLSGSIPPYEELVEAARQSGRRVGLFLAGDFAHAARVALSECAPNVSLTVAADLRSACKQVPALADLLRLAVSPEYASARWNGDDGASSRTPSDRFSLF